MSYIDLETWPRRKHFELFNAMDYPHFNLCGELDMTQLYPWTREQDVSFFQTMIYLLTRAAHEVEAFRLRIRPEGVFCHERVRPSVTVPTAGNLFGFCTFDYTPDYGQFLAQATEAIAAAQAHPSLEDEPGRDDLLYMTSIPWVSLTSLQHPIHLHPVDSIPRLAWGKVTPNGAGYRMSLCVQVHHALADGWHVGRYFTLVQQLANTPGAW